MLEFVFAALTLNAQSDSWVLGAILHILVVPSVWGAWLGRLSGGLRPWAWVLAAPFVLLLVGLITQASDSWALAVAVVLSPVIAVVAAAGVGLGRWSVRSLKKAARPLVIGGDGMSPPRPSVETQESTVQPS
jgi:hypothetical protein